MSRSLSSTSEDITVSLLKVAQNIEDICNMSSFSGETADQAKYYFSDFHLTMLTTFNGLLHDLYQNLNQHIEDFQSKVDESSKTIINSDYVRDTMEDLHEQNEALEVLHSEVSNIIRSVSDISSATTPSFRFVKDDHDMAIDVAENVLEDVQSFTSVGRRSSAEIESLLQEIRTTLNHARAVSGSARFTDYKGGETTVGLAALKEYNKTIGTPVEVNQDSIKKMSLMEIKHLNDAAVKGMDERNQKILNRAYTDLISEKIDRATYYNIFVAMKILSQGGVSRLSVNQRKLEIDTWWDKTVTNSVRQTEYIWKLGSALYKANNNEDVEREITSVAADLTPVLSNFKAGYEILFSVDPITGRELESWERALSGVGIIGGPLIKGVKHGGKLIKGTSNVRDISKITTKITVNDIPTAKSGNFNIFFNSLTSRELDELWLDKMIRKRIERQLRAPGGLNEWHLVSRAPQFKYWNIGSEKIKELRTVISDVKFVNPNGAHGGLGSTKAHNELFNRYF
ncbi:T7SS effector LXG polymorphic toxin [Salipaludibacillus sp. HK11]|uniref:T7SS effector LXG polymorphic toxin n=1 Tax=Salipaludibacillus sp. HK11 TaxID=3394320 RepID=UPI0039FD310D